MIKAYGCPRCRNTTEKEGITLSFLEWRVIPVVGVHNDCVVMDYNENTGEEVQQRLICENVPSKYEDLEHYHCNACGHKWVDEKSQLDTSEV